MGYLGDPLTHFAYFVCFKMLVWLSALVNCANVMSCRQVFCVCVSVLLTACLCVSLCVCVCVCVGVCVCAGDQSIADAPLQGSVQRPGS